MYTENHEDLKYNLTMALLAKYDYNKTNRENMHLINTFVNILYNNIVGIKD